MFVAGRVDLVEAAKEALRETREVEVSKVDVRQVTTGKYGTYSVTAVVSVDGHEEGVVVLASAEQTRASARARAIRANRSLRVYRGPRGELVADTRESNAGVLASLAAGLAAAVAGAMLAIPLPPPRRRRVLAELERTGSSGPAPAGPHYRQPADPHRYLASPGWQALGIVRDDAQELRIRTGAAHLAPRVGAIAALAGMLLVMSGLIMVLPAIAIDAVGEATLSPWYRWVLLGLVALLTGVLLRKMPPRKPTDVVFDHRTRRIFTEGPKERVEHGAFEGVTSVDASAGDTAPAALRTVTLAFTGEEAVRLFDDRDPRIANAVASRIAEVVGRQAGTTT